MSAEILIFIMIMFLFMSQMNFLKNSATLFMSKSIFYHHGNYDFKEINDKYRNTDLLELPTGIYQGVFVISHKSVEVKYEFKDNNVLEKTFCVNGKYLKDQSDFKMEGALMSFKNAFIYNDLFPFKNEGIDLKPKGIEITLFNLKESQNNGLKVMLYKKITNQDYCATKQ